MADNSYIADLDTGPPASGAELSAFRTEVLAFHREHRRDLPWRETRDPYAILVSEIMLQQTQVPRVLPKYSEFLAAFPGFASLATAPLAVVLDEWSGLGYNRRALNLKRIAEIIVSDHEGRLPREPAELTALPGIGDATASAIATYAFGAFAPFIETNVRAVFLDRFFPDAERVPDSLLRPIVAAAWDRDDPREWGYALMDLGTHLKRAQPNPSRRSSHHTQQSRFAGSDRQARGAFLRTLIREGECATAELAAEAGVEEDRAARLLDDLQKEGFVSRDGRAIWSVAG